jgi:hypothetical protein
MSHAADVQDLERIVQELADTLVLGSLLSEVRDSLGSYELVAHWKQGEFHHDVVIRLADGVTAGGLVLEDHVLVVATNCNGGIKEVLCFAEVPPRYALWHWRCPHVSDFSGSLPPLLARAQTVHWFNPCDLLVDDARSELREEFRERQPGGGWQVSSSCGAAKPEC